MQNVLVDDRRIWVDLWVSRMPPGRDLSNSIVLAPNQWQDSTRVGRMMSNCRLDGASEEAEILNRRESIAPAAEVELGTDMEWCLTSTSSHALTEAIVVGHANVAGGQGRPPRAGGEAGTGGGALNLTARGTGARFVSRHVTLWLNSCAAPLDSPLPPCPLSSRLVFSTVIPNQKRPVAVDLLSNWRWRRL
jgi:hypothetical protein